MLWLVDVSTWLAGYLILTLAMTDFTSAASSAVNLNPLHLLPQSKEYTLGALSLLSISQTVGLTFYASGETISRRVEASKQANAKRARYF